MASNQIPYSYDPLVQLLEDAADGVTAHGPAVGVKQNDAATLSGVLVGLVGAPAGPGNVPPAIPGAKALWNTAKAGKSAASAALRVAISNGRALTMACVGNLKLRLGAEWSAAWQAAGFTGGSLVTPTNPQARLQELRAYYAAHPTHEAQLTETIAATAAACQAAADAIGTATTASNASNTAAGQAKAALEAGIATARTRLTGLRNELAQFLGAGDERWYLFGFERPADPETPEVPESVVVTPGAAGSGTVFVDFDDARRAESYRVTVTAVASGAGVAERLVEESEAMFTGLTAGLAVKIAVSARNAEGGESAASAPVAATVP